MVRIGLLLAQPFLNGRQMWKSHAWREPSRNLMSSQPPVNQRLMAQWTARYS
jgi:hypothetical protein